MFGLNCYIIRIIANFVSKLPNFRYHGNKGRSLVNLNDTVKLHDLENRPFDAGFLTIAPV